MKKSFVLSCAIELLVFIMLLSTATTQQNTTVIIVVDPTTTNETTTNNSLPIPAWLQNSQKQLTLYMNDTYNYFVTKNGNKVWACAMNLAWNQLKRGFLFGKNATFSDLNTVQQKIADNFNAQTFTRNDLSEDAYYVSSGYGKSAVQRINFQVKSKFPSRTFQPLQLDLKEKDFISYAYLLKNFQYKTSFAVLNNFKFKDVVVEAFQSNMAKHRNQLYYKYYNNTNNFLMGIETKNQNDEILLLKSNQSEIKNFTVEMIVQMIKIFDTLPNNKFKKTDSFRMPVLEFDFTRNYQEMNKAQFTNVQLKDYIIAQMFQRLKLQVTRKGVQVQNQAVVAGVRSSFMFDPKYFYLNNDFWLILKEKNKMPYLIVSVASVKQTWAA